MTEEKNLSEKELEKVSGGGIIEGMSERQLTNLSEFLGTNMVVYNDEGSQLEIGPANPDLIIQEIKGIAYQPNAVNINEYLSASKFNTSKYIKELDCDAFVHNAEFLPKEYYRKYFRH